MTGPFLYLIEDDFEQQVIRINTIKQILKTASSTGSKMPHLVTIRYEADEIHLKFNNEAKRNDLFDKLIGRLTADGFLTKIS